MHRIISFGKKVGLAILLAFCLIGCWGDYEAGETVYPAAIDAGDSAAIRAILDSNGLMNVTVRKVIDQYAKGKINYLNMDSLGLYSFSFTKDFNMLDSIRTINLSQNNILKVRVLDSIAFHAENRCVIMVNHNLLDSLPLCLLGIRGIQGIELEYNKIDSIPAEIVNYNGATVSVDVEHNLIASIPSALVTQGFHSIFLRYNKLCNISDSATIAWLNSLDAYWKQNQNCP
ncbi:MAG TPA: hypothetical protein VKF42_09765 [Chitinivibrionales bacterium]|jgi:Leucine-rich repeat (LRR) protein|nr:hypothetical protein [Chitinivibrionales bacterium]